MAFITRFFGGDPITPGCYTGQMKKLHGFGFLERPLAGLLAERLRGEGIACILRNDQLSSAIGEIPFIECAPELWVIDDETWPRARLLLDHWLQQDQGDDWTCPRCAEQIEGQFDSCWACGAARD